MQTPTRTTELEAVNVMLSLLGESPVASMEPPYNVDVANARKLLYESSKDVQMEGWAFNKETDYTLALSGTDVPIPSNCISFDTEDFSVDVVIRGEKLYDRKSHSFEFDHAIKGDIMFMFPYDELPECARRYIMIRAARKLQSRFLGSAQQDAFSQDDETYARVKLMEEEGDQSDYNILNGADQAYIARRWQARRAGR